MSEPASDAQPGSYYEPARSYAVLWVFAGLLAAGFVLDLALGGGVAHLPGWLIAAAVVLGANWLIVYAARAHKSLRLTAAELRVGDAAIDRAHIVGLREPVDDEGLPVLGWPTGAPRGLHGVTVRLADGRDVVVPTRFPDRLTAALGLAAAPERRPEVRPATPADLPLLDELGDRADAIFRAAGYDLPDISTDLDELRNAAAVFVAGDPPVGYVQVADVDGLAYVAELAVIPRWMRKGVGTALLERACAWARGNGYPAITLTTFADVPWNAPFYAARGFVEVAEPSPGLAAVRRREAELGLDAVGRRVVMRRDL